MLPNVGYQRKAGHFVIPTGYVELRFKQSKTLLPNYFDLLRDFARLLTQDDQIRASKMSRLKLVAPNA
jgi:hypothetical protein